jgi:hypothetical protein
MLGLMGNGWVEVSPRLTCIGAGLVTGGVLFPSIFFTISLTSLLFFSLLFYFPAILFATIPFTLCTEKDDYKQE